MLRPNLIGPEINRLSWSRPVSDIMNQSILCIKWTVCMQIVLQIVLCSIDP